MGYRVIRPVFEGALEDLNRGVAPNGERLDGLIVYDIDRLTRDNRRLEDAIEVMQNFGRPIIDITGTLDLLTDNGRTVARIVTATNNEQSADTARRVSRKIEKLTNSVERPSLVCKVPLRVRLALRVHERTTPSGHGAPH
ncbi:recombinase family protein [Streptomyces sp. NPDC127079]|uniref:recombinase family protein n=1 Tax=Streptomyces sp. NPDC127079 TaxID=3347132 RepID=UPI0036515A6C